MRDCVARDESSTNVYQLTDERGCILKPKLFGAFQKTNDTGNTGASIIAYAFFQAFKFPDVMDLFIECNVELCKVNCEPCPEANQVNFMLRSNSGGSWKTIELFLHIQMVGTRVSCSKLNQADVVVQSPIPAR